ncbi:Peptidase propeptide and YPEB domain protein [Nonomuraea coxensis DSM 45129]|uniref:Peptidase propeptide and YPEB domain protein n=1 Tax=Nonomuraea coxensis DSM 45129 TaxID=1122611 RepID=A0ABX8TZT0_9ACTN|nr:PepSY domain-containing protein [Nonomuraea coxensis]QYC40793.1 Peptidase propeptide and YPEB domain protein [Nonomuraea coxensis DSM 45129]
MNKTLMGVLAGATLLTGGCGGQAAHEAQGVERLAAQPPSPTEGVPSAPPTGPAASTPATGSPTPGAAGAEDLKRAAQVALAAAPGAALVSIESEENGSRWEVKVADSDGTERQLDVAGGKVVSGPSVEDDDPEDKAKLKKLLSEVKVDHTQALDKITATVPEGRVTELDLDSKQGKPVWEADVVLPDGTKHEVAIDAVTGEATGPVTGGATPTSTGTATETGMPTGTETPAATESPTG